MVKRSDGLLDGLWGFVGNVVGTKSHAGQVAVERKAFVKTKLGGTLQNCELAGSVKHTFTHFAMTLNLYRCQIKGKINLQANQLMWVARKDLDGLAWSTADRKLLEQFIY